MKEKEKSSQESTSRLINTLFTNFYESLTLITKARRKSSHRSESMQTRNYRESNETSLEKVLPRVIRIVDLNPFEARVS